MCAIGSGEELMKMRDTNKRNQSQNMVWVVQILFGLVFAQSLLLYKSTLLGLFTPGNGIAFFALATVYVSTLISWKFDELFDNHRT